MIELPEDIQSHDIGQWLSDGYFFARPSGESEWKIASYIGTGDNREIGCRWVSADHGEYVPLQDVRAHWPTCGSINMPGFALYVQRLQRRQWRRTFNARCVSIGIPGKWQLLKSIDARELRVTTDSPEFLNAVFNPTYPATFDAAMDMLGSQPSVALSPQILLVGYPNPQVYYRGNLVGQMIGGKFNAECDPLTERRVSKLLGVMI
jgi:hypothetical protein